MSVSKALFTSNSDEWATPMDVYMSLDNEFHFTLDACATEKTINVTDISQKSKMDLIRIGAER